MHVGLVQHTDAHKMVNEGVALKETLGVLVIELEELMGGMSDFGEDESNMPDLTLVVEAVFTCELGGIEWLRVSKRGKRAANICFVFYS